MKSNFKNCWRLASVLLLLGCATALADDPLQVDSGVRSFMQQHCTDCHGADTAEGGFRIDRLSNDLQDRQASQRWVKVLDKVKSGQMPPADAEQPMVKQVEDFTASLSQALHVASFARQQREGRVVLRRLNRNEYETTLRDLLGPQVDVQDLLPDDNIAAGFDNVSAVLDVSAVHLLRYQEAAENAVRSVIPTRRPTKITTRYSGREITEKVKTFKGNLDKSARLDGDRLVLFARTYASVPCATARVTEPGRYRVRASVSAIGSGDHPLPVMLTHSGYQTPEVIADRRTLDVPAGETTVISAEFDLDAREIVVLNPWTLPSPRDLLKQEDAAPLSEYGGPGVIVEWMEIEGPLGEFPTSGYRRLFGDTPLALKYSRNPNTLELRPEQPRESAEQLIRSALPIVFRRPVAEPIANYFVGVAHQQLDRGETFTEAMVIAYTTMLCSPHFLYLNEPLQDDPSDRTQLDDYAVAARLSYFLWSSSPDAELLRLAAQGVLRRPSVLHDQVERMLKHPKAQRFADNFAGQWLDLRNINATTPNPRVYGEFDDFLFWSMPKETRLFFTEVLANDLPVTQFVDSDWSILNQRLAQHYGFANVHGGEMRKVTLPPDSHRGGVLTHASILKVTADGSRTSPVLRGKWVLERIVGRSPDPPPPNTPAIDPDVRGTTTIREQLDKHRNIAACARCHKHIDPPGFALESFDAIGGWRTFYRGDGKNRVDLPNYPGRTVSRGVDVELGGRMPDGRTFQDIDDYRQILLSDKDQIVRNLATKLIIYATGADIQFADRKVVEQLVADASKNDAGFRSLLHAVVQSRLFLSK